MKDQTEQPELQKAEKPIAGAFNQIDARTIFGDGQIQAAELIYFIYFSLLLGARAFGLIEGNTIYNVIFIVSMFLFLVKLVLTDYTVLEYILIFIFILTALIVYKNTGEKGLILNFSLMLGMKGVRQKRVICSAFLITAAGIITLFLLSWMGLVKDVYYFQDRGNGGDFRHALGYSHANTAQDWAVFLIFLFMMILGRISLQALIRASLLSFLFSTFFFFYTGSRTGWIITVIYLILNIVLQARGHLSKIGGLVCMAEYPVLLGISIAIPLLDETKIFSFLIERGNTLGARAAIAAQRWQISGGPHLFGNRFDYSQLTYGVDLSYLYLFLNLGIIPTILVSVLYFGMIWDQIRSQRLGELGVTVSLLLMGMTDPLLFNMSTKNLIMIFAGTWIFRETEYWQKRMQNRGKSSNRVGISLFSKVLRRKNPGQYRIILPQRVVRFIADEINSCIVVVSNRKVFWRQQVVFLGSAAVCAILFSSMVSKPAVVYSNLNTSEHGFLIGNLESVTMTQEDVQAAMSQGNLVIGYQDETTPMYVYQGNVPPHEYLRNMMKAAAIAGGAASVVSLFIYRSAIRKKTRKGVSGAV